MKAGFLFRLVIGFVLIISNFVPKFSDNNGTGLLLAFSLASTKATTTKKHVLFPKTKQFFDGKSVLLTGASGGLGRALAQQLADCGVSRIVLTGRNQSALEEVSRECIEITRTAGSASSNRGSSSSSTQKGTIETYVLVCDFLNQQHGGNTNEERASSSSSSSVCSTIEELGSSALKICNGTIDVLINSAGVTSQTRTGGNSNNNNVVTTRGDFVNEVEPEILEKVMQVNFFAGVSLTKQLLPAMIEKPGSGCGTILWISGVMGRVGLPSRTGNVASKFAIQGFAESLRAEVADRGIGVHVASPGYIRTFNSIEGTEQYQKGEDPIKVATYILNSVAKGKNDFLAYPGASARVAIFLRFFFPSILEKIMRKRFRKSQNQTSSK